MRQMKEGGVGQAHSRQREKRVHLEQANLKQHEEAGGWRKRRWGAVARIGPHKPLAARLDEVLCARLWGFWACELWAATRVLKSRPDFYLD